MKHVRLFAALLFLGLDLLVVGLGTARADTIHVVQPGDSLEKIAATYGVTVQAIVEANGLSNADLIIVGQQLTIPGVDGPPAGAPSGATPAATPVAQTPVAQAPVAQTPGPVQAVAVDGGVMHTVQPGDSVYKLSLLYDVTVVEIVRANNLSNANVIIVGQELLIPGATLPSGAVAAAPAAPAAPSPATPAPAATAAPTSAELLPNSSFEGDWYFYLYNELQIPDGWLLVTDEGPVNLQPGAEGNFNRPEVRVVSKAALPENEHAQFVFDGFKTVKAFKGGAPTSFSMFTDLTLQPGTYRFTANFFPDLVARYYPGGRRDYTTDPLAGEVRIIRNDGGTGWEPVQPGTRNTRVYEFTVSEPGIVRLGASFRNRFPLANNGWFLDDWSLEKID